MKRRREAFCSIYYHTSIHPFVIYIYIYMYIYTNDPAVVPCTAAAATRAHREMHLSRLVESFIHDGHRRSWLLRKLRRRQPPLDDDTEIQINGIKLQWWPASATERASVKCAWRYRRSIDTGARVLTLATIRLDEGALSPTGPQSTPSLGDGYSASWLVDFLAHHLGSAGI